jgi:hypothetical protein
VTIFGIAQHLIGGVTKSTHIPSQFRSLRIQRQQLFDDLFIAQIGFPAIGRKDGLIEPLVRQFEPGGIQVGEHALWVARNRNFRSLRVEPVREYSSTSGLSLVIHNNDAIRGDFAFRHLERQRERAIGKQPLSNAQR